MSSVKKSTLELRMESYTRVSLMNTLKSKILKCIFAKLQFWQDITKKKFQKHKQKIVCWSNSYEGI
jgi:hypothetical protein